MSRLKEDVAVAAVEMFELKGGLIEEEISEAQQEDTLVSKILRILKKCEGEPPKANNLLPFLEIANKLFIDKSIVYRQLSDEEIQIVLRPSLHERVLELLHDAATSKYLEVDKTTATFLETFYWPSSRKIVARYVKQCERCEIFKSLKENSTAALQPIESYRIVK